MVEEPWLYVRPVTMTMSALEIELGQEFNQFTVMTNYGLLYFIVICYEDDQYNDCRQ